MEHPIYRVTSVDDLGSYRLRVGFDDGLTREIDLRPILEGELYRPLRDPSLFAKVTVDPEIHTVVWPNGADFDPATLHDWPSHELEMRKLAQRWRRNEMVGLDEARRRAVVKVVGIDFSGAKDAGRKIWLTEGDCLGGRLVVRRCSQAAGDLGWGRPPSKVLPRLAQHILDQPDGTFIGCDFPFSLPKALISQGTWKEFARNFPGTYATPEALRRDPTLPEPKRTTDLDSCTPFSPINLRLFKQTYYGIGHLLAPLLDHERIRVIPMQEPTGSLTLLEVCPASTLKHLGWKGRYKGNSPGSRKRREQILTALERDLVTLDGEANLRHRIVEDREGDALDSVLAAVAVCQVIEGHDQQSAPNSLEGYVYYKISPDKLELDR